MKKKLLLIEDYYTEALRQIKKSNFKEATKILYNKMPTDLYDLSLDILYNRNLKFSNAKLKDLIEKVDVALCEESKEPDLQEDNFGNQF